MRIKLLPALRPIKTEETVSHDQSNNDKEVRPIPVRSNLCTPLIAVSTAVREKVIKTESEKQAIEDQLSSKTIHPALTAQLHLPALDLSWTLYAVLCSFQCCFTPLQQDKPASYESPAPPPLLLISSGLLPLAFSTLYTIHLKPRLFNSIPCTFKTSPFQLYTLHLKPRQFQLYTLYI